MMPAEVSPGVVTSKQHVESYAIGEGLENYFGRQFCAKYGRS